MIRRICQPHQTTAVPARCLARADRVCRIRDSLTSDDAVMCDSLTSGDGVMCNSLTSGDGVMCDSLTAGDGVMCDSLTSGDGVMCDSLTSGDGVMCDRQPDGAMEPAEIPLIKGVWEQVKPKKVHHGVEVLIK